MARWRQVGIVVAVCTASILSIAAVLQFLAPGVSFEIRDSIAEWFSGGRGRTYRIALGAPTGSYYHMGVVLNQHLEATAGYELELVTTAGVPENVNALLDRDRGIHLATVDSSSDEATRANGLYGLARVGRQYLQVIVPNDSAVHDVRELAGPVNPGVRETDQASTLGERVLEYYGLTPPGGGASETGVSIVRPTSAGVLRDFEAGHMLAATRTQSLRSDLIQTVLNDGNYRLVPIRDHVALAQALPGTEPDFIPAGVYGPKRQIPPEPVPTIAVSSLLVARGDLPGRVVRDILRVVYDPRFARDLQYPLTEETGRKVGELRLHPAAELYYRRNDLVTSDWIGRCTFLAWIVGTVVAVSQFVVRFRQGERRKARRRLLALELDKLATIRRRIDEGPSLPEAQALVREADDLLCRAEHDAAAELLGIEGIQSLRSLHAVCWRALQQLGV
ncbi:MAG: TAXI family TRAP transporter solute-binding subunit [Vicinamibacterales bacterium]